MGLWSLCFIINSLIFQLVLVVIQCFPSDFINCIMAVILHCISWFGTVFIYFVWPLSTATIIIGCTIAYRCLVLISLNIYFSITLLQIVLYLFISPHDLLPSSEIPNSCENNSQIHDIIPNHFIFCFQVTFYWLLCSCHWLCLAIDTQWLQIIFRSHF